MLPNVSPPTDSLYKFWAIASLVMTLFFGFKLDEYNEKIEARKMEVIQLQYKVDSLCSVSEISDNDLNKALPESTARNESTKDTNFNKTSFDYNREILELKLKKLNESAREPIERQIHSIDQDVDDLRTDKLWVMTLFFLSLVIMTLGFVMWYRRDQIYKDKLLKHEVNSMIEHKKEESS